MSNWHPKPRRPQAENPLFELVEPEWTVNKSMTPIQRQRQLDGTPHTKTGPTRLHPGNVEPIGDKQPELYLGKSISNDGENEPVPADAEKIGKSLDPDLIVKSFLSKGTIAMESEEKEDTEKGTGAVAKVGGAALQVGTKAARAVGSVVPTSGR